MERREEEQEMMSPKEEEKSVEEEEEIQRLHDDDKEDEEEERQNKEGGDGEEDEGKEKTEKESKARCGDKKCIPGILYLGHIPPRLRPKHLRNMLSAYGEIGRIFLQPEDRQVRRKKQKQGVRRCDFTEGWVEFRDKRIAKKVAASLHNTPMGSRKRQRHYADLWSIKYLHRFQWSHLNERLVYEQTVLNQRLRTEVSQVKKESNFYLDNVEKSARMERVKKRKERAGEPVEEKNWDFTQRRTEEEIQMKKRKKKELEKSRLLQEKSQSNVSLLAKIFNSSQS
ncbi:activator of basal transcription 1 [Gouania willdenowi]|nr:activator of basal transcription 1 [Gouania willdenowi]XP_028308830.1 activator of basal transcription 1 [Gouania willdenowi]XP_028308831.1 activator of basal transcription 1 [Gouania willdenowi]